MKATSSSAFFILSALWLMMFSASSQTIIMSPILPIIETQLHVPQAILGTLATSYSVMLGVFALIMGPISDRIGRRRVLIMGTGAMTLTLAVHYWVTDYTTMLIVRALSGAAGGMLSGVAPAYIGDYFPSERRGWANGVVMTGIAAGQILGVPAGTLLADRFSFVAPFVFFSIPMAFSFVVTCLKVPQPAVQRADPVSLRGSVIRYLNMLRVSHIAAAAGAYCMMFMGLAFYVIYLPTWLTSRFGATATEIATLFVVGGLASVMVGPKMGKISDAIGRKGLIIWTCVGLSLLMGVTTFLLSAFWLAYPLFFVIMVLVAARMGPFQALLSEIVSDEQRGSMMSLSIALGQLAMGLGSALSGFVYTDYGYGFSSIIGAVGMLLMGVLVWRYIGETRVNPPGRNA